MGKRVLLPSSAGAAVAVRRRSPDEKNALAGQKGSTLGNFSPDGKSIFLSRGWGNGEL